MRKLSLISAIAILLTSGMSSARTWYVRLDGTGDAFTIQAGVDSASAGDTVLVGSGVYSDSVEVDKERLVLLSESGAGLTTIDGVGAWNAIRVVADEVTIDGFPITNSTWAVNAGVFSPSQGVEVANCVVFGNAGTGIVAASYVHDNVVHNNGAGIWGGTLAEANEIRDNHAAGVVGFDRVIGNEISGNTSYDSGDGPVSGAYGCSQVIDNTFTGNGQAVTLFCEVIEANRLVGNYGGIDIIWYDGVVRGSLISGNGADGAIRMIYDVSPLLEYNTIDGNSGSGILLVPYYDHDDDEWYNPNPTIRNNIITSNGYGISNQAVPIEVHCNDVWNNTSGDYVGSITRDTDIAPDPMFCGSVSGDSYLDCNSPCADGPVCGQIGAYAVGCGASRTEPTTWGEIKAMYR